MTDTRTFIRIVEAHNTFQGAYATLPFYIVTVALAKVAILLFYLRLNPNKHFRYRVFAVLTITVAYMILLLMVQIFSCNPIRKFWDLSLAKTGHCLNIEGLYLATPIINTILDVLVLIIPIPMVMKLQVSWRYKLGLGVLFAVGSATVILSGIRIWSVAENNRLEDVTYVAATGCVLFVVETNLSVACGCIIMLRPFYRRCSLAISSALGLGREKSGGTSKRTPDLRAFDGTTVMGSHGEYRTKVSGYTGSKPSTNRSGGWPEWSWALNTKSRNEEAGEDEDLEGLNAELKQFAPIAHTHNRQDHSEKHYGHKHSGSTTKGDEESGNASLDGHINFAPGENSRLGGLSLEDGIVKTVSLDIR